MSLFAMVTLDRVGAALLAHLPWFITGAALVIVHAGVLLARQPEPASEVPGADSKTSYAQLASPRMIMTCLALFCLCQPMVMRADLVHRPAWLVWSSAFVVLVAVDAASTWIPRRLARLCLIELCVALVVGAVAMGERPQAPAPSLPGNELPAGWATTLLMIGAGSCLSAVFLSAIFWLIWRTGSGLGFADVRMATAVGALTGSISAEFTMIAIVAAAVMGVVLALVHRLIAAHVIATHAGFFAYAPALWTGPWAAFLVRLLG